MKKYRLLHREIAVTPLTLGIIHRGFHQQLHRKYTRPLYFKNSVVAYHDLKCDWYGDTDNFRDLGFKIIANSQADIHYRDRVLRETIACGRKLFSLNRKINHSSLKKISNRGLSQLLLRLYGLGSDLADVGGVAAIPDVAFNNFSKCLKAVIDQAVKKYKPRQTTNEYFNVLTSSGKGSLTQEENLTILKLALIINWNKKLVKLFKDQPVSELEIILSTKYREIFGKILKIKNKYQWLAFGHVGPAKETAEYLEDFKVILSDGEIKEKLATISKEIRELKIKQAQYFQELKLVASEQQLFKTAQNFSYNKAYRYDILLYTYFTLDKLLRETSRRVSLSLNDLRFLSPEEIVLFIKGQEAVKRSEIKARQQFCVVLIKGRGVTSLTGLIAQNYLKTNIQQEKIRKNLTIIHGTAAYLGRVTGRVKVINRTNEMGKVEAGDILVAAQTTPDLVPAMKKAAAFVTDIGGITSHAAIVAREMKKPCIIGTKIATQVLHDNDLVEVNANEGDVMKL